jgi:hypothetical protein
VVDNRIQKSQKTTATASPIGTTREEVVYELFFTALPQGAFTPADVCVQPAPQADTPIPTSRLSRAQRAHWRLSWAERLARMPMPKPLPPFRSRCSGCRLSWLLSSIYQPSDSDHGLSHGGRLQQCVALESGHVICMLRHDTHHQYIPGDAIEDHLPMVENWLRGRRDSSWSGRSSIDAKIAVDFDITDNQARVAESRVRV